MEKCSSIETRSVAICCTTYCTRMCENPGSREISLHGFYRTRYNTITRSRLLSINSSYSPQHCSNYVIVAHFLQMVVSSWAANLCGPPKDYFRVLTHYTFRVFYAGFVPKNGPSRLRVMGMEEDRFAHRYSWVEGPILITEELRSESPLGLGS